MWIAQSGVPVNRYQMEIICRNVCVNHISLPLYKGWDITKLVAITLFVDIFYFYLQIIL
jgi:hypothetical protein